MARQLMLFKGYDEVSFYSLVDENFLPEENFEIEYKSGKEGFPKDLWKTYSAFANTNTGFIIIGIKENSKGFSVEGLSSKQLESYQKEFWNNCNNPNTISRNLLSNEDLKVVSFKGKNLLVLRIPFASRTERPVYLTRNPFRNTYKRNHEGDYRCTDDEVKRMLADSASELKKDSLILEGFDINDLDPQTIRQFRLLFASTNANHPWLPLEDIDLLRKIGAYRKDRKTKQEGITLAGLLMFGKGDSIREQDVVPDFFPDFRESLSTDKNIRWTDRIYPDGTWENNLLQFYLKVWPKLIATLPKPFQLDKDERMDETQAHVALREAFVNTLVHTDYSLSGNIIIKLELERFVFSNPGTLLVSLHQYYAGGISECRNPSLQLMFLLIGRAEKAGSGVDKIMSGWRSLLWKRPFVELESQPDRVKLTMPMFSIIPKNVLKELQNRFGNVEHLPANELTILSYALIEDSISNQRLQYVLDIHSTEISAILKNLCEQNYLKSDNKGRWTTYRLARKIDTSTQTTENQNHGERRTNKSHKKIDTSDTKVDTSKIKIGKRLKRSELEELIMEICNTRYVKMEEVANRIDRSFDYLKNKIFPQMIRDGKLVKKYPLTQNHPEQAYKTKK